MPAARKSPRRRRSPSTSPTRKRSTPKKSPRRRRSQSKSPTRKRSPSTKKSPRAIRQEYRTSIRKSKKAFRDYLKSTYDLKPGSALVQACTLSAIPPYGSFHVGVVQGPSGSGKSTTLAKFTPAMRVIKMRADMPLMDQLGSTPQEAEAMLFAVALNNIPDWMQPFQRLSTGQKFRAELAMTLSKRKPHHFLVMDEFGSMLDENTAQAISHRLQKFARRENISVVLATNRRSLSTFLRPEWVLDTQACTFTVQPYRNWPQPKLKLIFQFVDSKDERSELWEMFRRYHYLDHALVGHAKVFRVTCNGQLCALQASKRHFNPSNMVHAHRTVVLPQFQGLGIGTVIHDTIGAYVASLTRWSKEGKDGSVKWHKKRGEFSVVTSHTKLAAAHAKDKANWQTKYMNTQHNPNEKVFKKEDRKMNAFHYHGPPLKGTFANVYDKHAKTPQQLSFSRTISVR